MNDQWEEDWKFYQNMKDERQIGSIAGKDIKLAEKEKRKYIREEKTEIFRRKHNDQMGSATMVSSDMDLGDDSICNENNNDLTSDPDLFYKAKKQPKN